MIIADDDDDVLEHEAEEQARSFLVSDIPSEPEAAAEADQAEGGDDEQHFRILPLVLRMLEAHAAGGGEGGRLDVHMSAIRGQLRRCETFLAELQQEALSDDPNEERRLTELLAKRTELLSEHASRRVPKRDREEEG